MCVCVGIRLLTGGVLLLWFVQAGFVHEPYVFPDFYKLTELGGAAMKTRTTLKRKRLDKP